jgi:hypothetical protein
MNRNYELSREADQILKNAGLDIFGRENGNYEQIRFEQRMQTGAYSANQSKRK